MYFSGRFPHLASLEWALRGPPGARTWATPWWGCGSQADSWWVLPDQQVASARQRHTMTPWLKTSALRKKQILLVAVKREEMNLNRRNKVSLHVLPVRIAIIFYTPAFTHRHDWLWALWRCVDTSKNCQKHLHTIPPAYTHAQTHTHAK